jgi:hypothetical protein
MKLRWRPWRPLAAEDELARITRAIRQRCTCIGRDPDAPLLTGHEPDCSLQNSGWLT